MERIHFFWSSSTSPDEEGIKTEASAASSRYFRSSTSPDEEGIKTGIRTSCRHLPRVRAPALTKKGLRLTVIDHAPRFLFVRAPALTKKGLRLIDALDEVVSQLRSSTSPDEEGIKTLIQTHGVFPSPVRAPALTKKGLRRSRLHRQSSFCSVFEHQP